MKKLIVFISFVLVAQFANASNRPFLQYNFAVQHEGTDPTSDSNRYTVGVFRNGDVRLFQSFDGLRIPVSEMKLNRKALSRFARPAFDLSKAELDIVHRGAVCEIFVSDEMLYDDLFVMKKSRLALVSSQTGCFMTKQVSPKFDQLKLEAQKLKFALRILGLHLLDSHRSF